MDEFGYSPAYRAHDPYDPYGTRRSQQMKVPFVDGRDGAMNFPMGPNSNANPLDKNKPIMWYIETDNFGHKTVCDPYEINLIQPAPEPTVNDIMAQMQVLSDKINMLMEGRANESVVAAKPNARSSKSAVPSES